MYGNQWGYPPTPPFIVYPPPPPSSPVRETDPVKQLEDYISSAKRLQDLIKGEKKEEKKDDRKSFDWKGLCQLLFWAAPITGTIQILICIALYRVLKAALSTPI